MIPQFEPPVRLCCGQRHYGVMCGDGKVMCCMCFSRFAVHDLWHEDGRPTNVCRECHYAEQQALKLRRQVHVKLVTRDGLINYMTVPHEVAEQGHIVRAFVGHDVSDKGHTRRYVRVLQNHQYAESIYEFHEVA